MIHTEDKDVVTRTEALMLAFGWQGGTVHQVAEKTGCDAHDIIYSKAASHSTDYAEGWFAYASCSFEHNQQFCAGKRGNLQFWLGVASGVQTCLKTRRPTPRKF
jgi:hypothetical protein